MSSAYLVSDMRFQTAEEVLLALHQKKVDVALLDAFVTAAQKFALIDKELKVKKVISANTAFGFVLSKEMVRLENDFKSHVSSNQDRVTQFISNMTNMLEVRNTNIESMSCVSGLLGAKSSVKKYFQRVEVRNDSYINH